MSLLALMKSAKTAGEQPSIKHTVDMYYLKKSQETDQERYIDRLMRFQPSQLSYNGSCPRAYHLVMRRDEYGISFIQEPKFSASMMRVFDHGHALHALYQDKVLGPAGVLYGEWQHQRTGEKIEGFMPQNEQSLWRYVEPRLIWPEMRITGYCDGIIFVNGQWCILEIKSANNNSFMYVKSTGKPRDYHVRQAQIYVFAPKPTLSQQMHISGVLMLYINKDTGEEAEFYVPRDEGIMGAIANNIQQSIAAADSPNLPPRLSDCKSERSPRAKDCHACGACFSLPNGSNDELF